MYNFAIVEDDDESVVKLEDCLKRYSLESGIEYQSTRFKNGAGFIAQHKPNFDIIFMDIDMPKMNGFEAAKKLREMDSEVVLFFVTFLAKYAIRGYEFDAFDYILKPIVFGSLKIKLDKALRFIKRKANRELVLPLNSGFLRINIHSLNYVEIDGHKITYHTTEGNYESYGTMKMVEKVLPTNLFCKCSRSYIVNLHNVYKFENDYVVVGQDKLFIGRTRKKEFLEAMQRYELYGE